MHRLDNALKRLASDDKAYVNMRSLVANAIVGQLLHDGVVKGGTSLKMRFGDAATRVTTDLDTARAANLDKFVAELHDSLQEGWCGFAGRIIPGRPAHPEGVPPHYVMQPFDIKLAYLGKSWCTVSLEVGHNEIGDANNPEYVIPAEANSYLSKLGFPSLDPVALMPLHHQVAQKLHGVSEPGSIRAHDLIDLQIIMENGEVNMGKTRQACERLFAYRQTQTWPPVIVEKTSWSTLYEEQRGDLAVAKTAGEAVTWANNLIGRIAVADTVNQP